jgi:hypothetical protein
MPRPTWPELDDRVNEWLADRQGQELHEAMGWTEDEAISWVRGNLCPDRPLVPRPASRREAPA